MWNKKKLIGIKHMKKIECKCHKVKDTKPSQVEKKKCSKAAFYDPQCKACNEANEVEDTQPFGEWGEDFKDIYLKWKNEAGLVNFHDVEVLNERYSVFIHQLLLTQRSKLVGEISKKAFIVDEDDDFHKVVLLDDVLEVLKGKNK